MSNRTYLFQFQRKWCRTYHMLGTSPLWNCWGFPRVVDPMPCLGHTTWSAPVGRSASSQLAQQGSVSQLGTQLGLQKAEKDSPTPPFLPTNNLTRRHVSPLLSVRFRVHEGEVLKAAVCAVAMPTWFVFWGTGLTMRGWKVRFDSSHS